MRNRAVETAVERSRYTPIISIAPMMDRTDRHFRYFLRQITRRALLYTEMVTAKAVIHGNRSMLLGFHKDEHPLALQLAGNNAEELGKAVNIAEEYGYDEYNLNIGCPSGRVHNGHFGACLMAEPQLVAQLVTAMMEQTHKPVTVKHRIGIDGRESYNDMRQFVQIVAEAGVRRFTIHARTAVLGGLSPKQNRSVPPLRYYDVYRLKQDFPELDIEINGGIRGLSSAREHLRHVDAVMMGRAVYENPFLLAAVDTEFFDIADTHTKAEKKIGTNASGEADNTCEKASGIAERTDVAKAMYAYIAGLPPKEARHAACRMMGLFAGCAGAKRWRKALSTGVPNKAQAGGTFHTDTQTGRLGTQILDRALEAVENSKVLIHTR